nr:hypothetical protein [Clostridia bacterium]
MTEIVGKYNTARCFAGTIGENAVEQIRAVCDMEEFSSSKIRIMPDVHAGRGLS